LIEVTSINLKLRMTQVFSSKLFRIE